MLLTVAGLPREKCERCGAVVRLSHTGPSNPPAWWFELVSAVDEVIVDGAPLTEPGETMEWWRIHTPESCDARRAEEET